MTSFRPLRATRRWWRGVRPAHGTFRRSASTGVPGAIGGVPDGMAAATLVGVNPIHGLYATAVGRIAGGLTVDSQRMIVTTTSAAALAAGSAVVGVAPDDRVAAIILVTLLAGVAMVLAGVARLGRLTGFVSHSVMTGFLTGVSVNIILGQLAPLTGADPDAPLAVGRAWEVVTSPGTWNVPTLLVGGVAAVLLVGLSRTALAPYAAVVALLVTGLGVWLAGLGSVELVSDSGEIPVGLPAPALPQLALLSTDVVVGALAVAAIVLVQGAGVAESAPNPGGRRADPDKNFVGQGVANIAVGIFRGIPVGGSVGQTAISTAAGAKDRWTGILSGMWVLVVLVALSGPVGAVPSATLAAILLVASVGSIRVSAMATAVRTGGQSQIAMATTFLATLLLPVAAAVGIGAALSILLQANRESQDLRIVRLTRLDDGHVREAAAPRSLPDDDVTVLDVYGSLFYAGARSLEAALPDPSRSRNAAVVLRLRGRVSLGATAFTVLASYADRLGDRGGRLFVSGVDPSLAAKFASVIDLREHERIAVYPAKAVIGESTEQARRHAEAWLLHGVETQQIPIVRAPGPLRRLWSRAEGLFHRGSSHHDQSRPPAIPPSSTDTEADDDRE
ncbi:SulP family inorganic anion transporter [Cellulosimicrobium arenosum]|uniref:SulP family inorganic anion transporter n=1 Tax=Cellulosimicrobium arenosum TaxID=2708133 RepID=A0A927G777_9MICO|nr:SulP family inorganic anion transporter [Cellulosimicrobium arenosum]MBD8078164.1 SulP family inorganic anion transporter [Cellulosimicrobium arenosum]